MGKLSAVRTSQIAYALDFRTEDEIVQGSTRPNPRPDVDGEKLKEAMSLTKQRSSKLDDANWAYVTQQVPTIKEET